MSWPAFSKGGNIFQLHWTWAVPATRHGGYLSVPNRVVRCGVCSECHAAGAAYCYFLDFTSSLVEWQPFETDAAVQLLGYEVRYGPVGVRWDETTILRLTTSQTQAVLTDLQIGQTYRVLTSAVTTVGQGRTVKTISSGPSLLGVFVPEGSGSTRGGDLISLFGNNFKFDDESPTVFYGPSDDAHQYVCEPLFVNRTYIQCVTAVGVGVVNTFSVQTLGASSTASKVFFDYEMPMVFNQSLDGQFESLKLADGNVRGLMPQGETLMLQGESFGDDTQIFHVRIGHFKCLVLEVNQTWLTILTPIGVGTELPLSVRLGLDELAAILISPTSTNVFSYPESPILNSISCGQKGCPTTGHRVTITGQNFGAIEGMINVAAAGKPCINIELYSPTSLSCQLSPGKGTALPIQVFVGGLSSHVRHILSFSAPEVFSIVSAGCAFTDEKGKAVDCEIGQKISINGAYFGSSKAVVYVGNDECLDVKHDPSLPNHQLVCTLPPALRIPKVVYVFQYMGTVSRKFGRLSYKTCQNGTEPTPEHTCVVCQPGFFSPGSNQYCQACSPGRYNNQAGSETCLFCPRGFYSADPNSTHCEVCPAGLHAADPGSRLCRECQPADAYAYLGYKCHGCPEGGICENGLLRSATGFWHLDNGVRIDGYKCPAGFCEEAKCGPFRNDVMCGKCDEGFYRKGQLCERCVRGSEWFGIMVFANFLPVFLVVLAEVNVLVPGQFIKMLTYYIQCVVLVFDSSEFPALLEVAGFLTMSSKVDVTTTVPDDVNCYQATPLAAFWIELSRPFISAIQLGVIVCVAYVINRVQKKGAFSLVRWKTSFYGLFLTCYFPTIRVSLSVLVSRLVGKEYRLVAEPSILCASDDYRILQIFAIFVLLIFLLLQVQLMWTLVQRAKVISAPTVDDYVSWRALVKLLKGIDKAAKIKGLLKFRKKQTALDFGQADTDFHEAEVPDDKELFFQQYEDSVRKLAVGPNIGLFRKYKHDLEQFQSVFLDYRPAAGFYELFRLIWKSAFVFTFTFCNGRDRYLGYAIIAMLQLLLSIYMHPYAQAKTVFRDPTIIRWVNRSSTIEFAVYTMLLSTITLSFGIERFTTIQFVVLGLHVATVGGLIGLTVLLNIKLKFSKNAVCKLEELVDLLVAREQEDSRIFHPGLVRIDELMAELAKALKVGEAEHRTPKNPEPSNLLGREGSGQGNQTSNNPKDDDTLLADDIVKVAGTDPDTAERSENSKKVVGSSSNLSPKEDAPSNDQLPAEDAPAEPSNDQLPAEDTPAEPSNDEVLAEDAPVVPSNDLLLAEDAPAEPSNDLLLAEDAPSNGRLPANHHGIGNMVEILHIMFTLLLQNRVFAVEAQAPRRMSVVDMAKATVAAVKRRFSVAPTDIDSSSPPTELPNIAVASLKTTTGSAPTNIRPSHSQRKLKQKLKKLRKSFTKKDKNVVKGIPREQFQHLLSETLRSSIGLDPEGPELDFPVFVREFCCRFPGMELVFFHVVARAHKMHPTEAVHTLENGISKLPSFRVKKQHVLAEVAGSAKTGHSVAQANLGWLYEHGCGVRKSLSDAKFWYIKAALNGNTFARYHVGKLLLLEESNDIASLAKARKWLEAACQRGYKKADDVLDRLTSALEKMGAKSSDDIRINLREESLLVDHYQDVYSVDSMDSDSDESSTGISGSAKFELAQKASAKLLFTRSPRTKSKKKKKNGSRPPSTTRLTRVSSKSSGLGELGNSMSSKRRNLKTKAAVEKAKEDSGLQLSEIDVKLDKSGSPSTSNRRLAKSSSLSNQRLLNMKSSRTLLREAALKKKQCTEPLEGSGHIGTPPVAGVQVDDTNGAVARRQRLANNLKRPLRRRKRTRTKVAAVPQQC